MGRLVAVTAVAVLFAGLLASPAAAEEDGEELYELCAQCHGAAGQGNPEVAAPTIAGLSEWYVKNQLEKFKAGYRGTHPDDTGGLRMYPMSLAIRSDEQIAALSAYVASLPALPPETTLDGDPERGKALYTPCAACHGPEAGGLQALDAPAINRGNDWYLVTQLKHFKAGIRGTNPGDVTGARMRPMSMVLADEQAMEDVIAYVLSLSGDDS